MSSSDFGLNPVDRPFLAHGLLLPPHAFEFLSYAAPSFVFEGDTFRLVLREPSLSRALISKNLKLAGIANRLARIDVNPDSLIRLFSARASPMRRDCRIILRDPLGAMQG